MGMSGKRVWQVFGEMTETAAPVSISMQTNLPLSSTSTLYGCTVDFVPTELILLIRSSSEWAFSAASSACPDSSHRV